MNIIVISIAIRKEVLPLIEDYESSCDISHCDCEANESHETVYQNISSRNDLEEINTYDSIPISNNHNNTSKLKIIKKIYSLVAIFTVLLSVIFSSAEIFDIIFNDMETGNAIIKRIFGRALSEESSNIYELIISNSFLTIYDRSHTIETTPPILEDNKQSDNISVPNETVEKPFESSPPYESEAVLPPQEESDKSTPAQYPILPMDMSLISYGEAYIYNDTSLSPNISALASKPLNNYYHNEAPLVLVIHTHGTESYMPEGATYYTDEGELARSQMAEENMISVGKEFVRVLEENGIKTIHCVIMHDKESYRESYSRSAESIAKYLKEHPSIKYVFDLHRDSLMRSGGELISAVTTINGDNYAQIMPVIGSGADDWEENMTFALKLRSYLNSEYTNLCRPICLRESIYNQDMAAVSVLLEIGTSGNTLNEAKRAAILTANAISELIKDTQ